MLRCCHLDGLNQTDQHKVDASLIYADQQQPALTGIDQHWPVYIRLATTSHWSVRFKPSRWQHLRVLGPLAKDLSKESSKEITTTDSLEPSLDNSLAKVPRMLRCCHLDGLNQTDQHKVDASLIYADRHWPALTGIDQHWPALTGINRHWPAYKGCGSKSVYFQRIPSIWRYTDLLPHPLICWQSA